MSLFCRRVPSSPDTVPAPPGQQPHLSGRRPAGPAPAQTAGTPVRAQKAALGGGGAGRARGAALGGPCSGRQRAFVGAMTTMTTSVWQMMMRQWTCRYLLPPGDNGFH